MFRITDGVVEVPLFLARSADSHEVVKKYRQEAVVLQLYTITWKKEIV